LLTHWLKQHDGAGLYWVAEPTSAFDQLRSFSQAIATLADPESPPPSDFSYATWEHAFRQVSLLSRERRLALFVDEVTYLLDANPDFAGILQKAWDQWLSNSNLILALSGSQMGLMQKQILSYQAPLYGRATAQLELQPLPFGMATDYFPEYTSAERVGLYAMWGGVPAYWERLDPNLSVLENLSEQLLPANALILDEPRLLLQDFINDPYNYVGILRAITYGAQSAGDIVKRTGLDKGHVSKYLSILRDTGFVSREVPVTELGTDSRRGRYLVTDPYLRFFYRFLSADQSKLALGEQQQVLTSINNSMPQFIQIYTWRELCQEWLLRASARGAIPVPVERVGSEWKRSYTIDVVGINQAEKSLVLGASIWNEDPADSAPLKELVKRTTAVLPANEDWSVYHLGFAANGWQPDVAQQATVMATTAAEDKTWHSAGVRLLDLQEVDADLSQWRGFLAPPVL
jgi:AAA+ ATPase superfamily predicted ATPase